MLSFEEVSINEFKDINCFIGQNNVGKTNLLKLLEYFYEKLEGNSVLPPSLNSNYSAYGSITIVYDTTRIKSIVTSKTPNSKFQKHIYKVLFSGEPLGPFKSLFSSRSKYKGNARSSYELTLRINKNDSIEWSTKSSEIRSVLKHLYPFFSIQTRHIDLYDWNKLWTLISKLKSFNVDQLKSEDIIDYIDKSISDKSRSYGDFIEKVQRITSTTKYSYHDKILNYVKVGLEGHTFTIEGEGLSRQSDGTNSHKYLELFLDLLISLTRREYITPTVYIDEPEVGLHPKRNEELIYKLHSIYSLYKNTSGDRVVGKYKTPYPRVLISTHSPNIVKYIVRLFDKNQQIVHFSKKKRESTKLNVLNSQYDDSRFLNVFSDNEARLFFSHFILFVEGETELEIFGNLKLSEKFSVLRKIDVYRTNAVTLKYVNPSYSNLAIPYLVLYDADVLIDVHLKEETITYKSKKINLNTLHSQLLSTYYGSEKYKLKKSIENELKQVAGQKSLCEKKISFKMFKYESFIKRLNANVLSAYKTKLTHTTIEGCLINKSNLSLFLDWLEFEITHYVNVGGSGDMSNKISSFQKKYKKGKSLEYVFENLFSSNQIEGDLSKADLKFVNKLKKDHWNALKKEIDMHCDSDSEILQLFRLIFDGKTDSLVSVEIEYKKKQRQTKIDSDFLKFATDVKKNRLKKLEYLFGKTSGWATRFLNYSIDYIEEDIVNKSGGYLSFNTEFEKLFPELYDIIQVASDSIE